MWRGDPDIGPFCHIQQELYIAKGLVFRMNVIVLPENIQHRTIKAAHKLGHFGTSKTNQMLLERYWFPRMNKMVEEIQGQCFECKFATKQHLEQPVRIMPIPKKPWDTVAVDFGGSYPDGHFNRVAIDKRTRYPEVETTASTTCNPTTKKLTKMFATHGTDTKTGRKQWRASISSDQFAEFVREEGFTHHRVTPEHARANGEAGNFVKMLKTERITHLQGANRESAVQNMLTGYRSTPHPATGITSYRAMMERTPLDYTDKGPVWQRLRIQNKSESRADKWKHQRTHINVWRLCITQTAKHKWTTPFEPTFYIV